MWHEIAICFSSPKYSAFQLFQPGEMAGCFAGKHEPICAFIGAYWPIFATLLFNIPNCSSPTPTESAMIACFARQGSFCKAQADRAPGPDQRKDPRPALLRALCLSQKLSKEPHDTVGTSDAFDQLVLANIISMHSFEKRYYAPICSI